MSPANRRALKRFGIKLAILTAFALAQWLLGIMSAALFLAIFTAMLDVVGAIWRRERLLSPHITYWDEAAMFLVLFLALLICDR